MTPRIAVLSALRASLPPGPARPRRRFARLAIQAMVLHLLLGAPVAVEAQAAATLTELPPLLSADSGAFSLREEPQANAPAPRSLGYSLEDVLDPIPKTSSVTWQPTYQQRTNGTFNAYVKFKPVLVLESGLPLVTRIEWPIPEVDDENGPTNAGVGDLTWLTLFLVGGRGAWGVLGLGPVFVFPTASHSEMGDGKYQVGPALGYLNTGVTGWQFAFLLQQYASFAGDPQRSRVNQLTLQPFVTRFLPDSWYVQTQPVITLDFVKGTSSVPLNLVVGKLFAGRWDVSLQATAYPRWTSPPSKDYEIRLSVGYHMPALFSKP